MERRIDPPWRHWPDVLRITDSLQSAGILYAFYGGALRDVLLDKTPKDIDILAHSALPTLMDICKGAGLTPFALDNRTLRVVLPDVQMDIYALSSADYPQASSFEDLVRLKTDIGDFTFNACYLLPPDRFFDHHGGEEDLAAGRVCFTQNPYTQTRADANRIVRYFRFWSLFGKEKMDEVILRACTTNAPLLLEIRRPRAYAEVRKLLELPKPKPLLEVMHDRHILKYAFGLPLSDFSLLTVLETIEAAAGQQSPWYTKLFLLLLTAPLPPEKALEHLLTFWEFEPPQKTFLQDLFDFFPAADPAMPESEKTALIEKYGANFWRSMLFLRWALEDDIEATKALYIAALADSRE
jgi:poly(A) polymerase